MLVHGKGRVMSDHWRRVASVGDIPSGRMQAFDVGGRDVLVCNTTDGWFALDNTCSHAEARMDEGRLRGCRVTCPLHGGSFDVRDGRVLSGPAVSSLCTHAIRIVAGEVEIQLQRMQS
jgi:3-phenylpropionate/trans-cinnamate dioxygenase ferredoxin subunit